jgi:cobalt-zinc-cadmium efflux system protein
MSTTETAMTAHLVVPSGHPGDAFLTSLAHALEHDFDICHATVQIETSDHAGHACAPACQPVGVAAKKAVGLTL